MSHRKVSSIHGFVSSRQVCFETDAFVASLCMLHNPTVDFLSFFLRPAVLFPGMVIKKPNVVVSSFLVMCHIKRLCVSSIFVL